MNELNVQFDCVLRIFVACLCGIFIGYERKSRNKEAGIRTHAIVALGAALIMTVSKYGFSDITNYDASRVAAQIVSGVGFLGAGIIFVKHHTVSGLTTAAGIWATSGVGMAVGAGMYLLGISVSALMILLQMITHINRGKNNVDQKEFIIFLKTKENLDKIYTQIEVNNILIENVEMLEENDEVKMRFLLNFTNEFDMNRLIQEISKVQGVNNFRIN